MLRFGKFISSLIMLSCLILIACPAYAANFIGQWHMDNGSGTIASDSSSYGNDLVMSGGSDWTWDSNGHSNSCLISPNNTASYCSTDISNTSPLPDYQLTIEVWIKPTGIDVDGSQIVSLYEGGVLHFGTPAQDFLRFIGYVNETWPEAIFYGTDSILFDGQWHHVAGVWDGIPDENGKVSISLYVDMQLVAHTEIASSVPLSIGNPGGTTGSFLCVGANSWNPGGGTQNYFGAIDEVMIYKDAPTKFGCGALGYNAGDTNKDCYVDIFDLYALADTWVKCTSPVDLINCELAE